MGISLVQIELFRNLNLITMVAFFTSLLLVLTLRSEISPEGITSYNSLGATLFMPWGEIRKASRQNILGLGYFRIVDQDGDCIYVASYLTRQREFEAIVAAITDKKNPLLQCILNNNTEKAQETE